MNIALVSIESSPSLVFPMMQEMLRQRGHGCNIIHVSLHCYDDAFLKDFAQKIVEIGDSPGLIGISTLTNSFTACRDLVRHLRELTSAKIILGGIHPTVKPEEALEVADYVCVGEGEYALVELAGRLEQNQPTHDIQNIYTEADGRVVKNPLRPLIQNLDELPVPAFDLAHFYVFHQGRICHLAQNPDIIHSVYSSIYFIITSRGCPYVCTYCLNSALIQIDKAYRKIRRRSNQHIIQELRNFKKVYRQTVTIGFVDDDFCAQSEDNLANFLKLYKEEIGLPFFVASTPHSMTPRKMQMLVDAGLTRLEIGIQSINDDVNKLVYNRASRRQQVKEAVDMVSAYRHRVTLNYDLILDNPWESEAAKLETLRFLYTIPSPASINLYSLNLYPGTELYYRALKEGKIKDEQREIYQKNHMVDIRPDAINTLFILYLIYRSPVPVIEFLIRCKKVPGIGWLLKMMTLPLWKGRRWFCQGLSYGRRLGQLIVSPKKDDIRYLGRAAWQRLLGRKKRFAE